MIKNIKSKALRLYYEKDDGSKLPPSNLYKIKLIIGLLNAAKEPEDMNFPGSGLHRLSGNMNDFWSVKVSGNYRIIFKLENGDVYDIDYLDYH